MREPYNLTIEQIKRLNWWQIINIYFRDPDQPSPEEEPEPIGSYREVCYRHWKYHGNTLEQMREKWQELVRSKKAADEPEPNLERFA